MIPTPTESGVRLRRADFSTLTEALDYAASGESGFNYYDGRDNFTSTLPYRQLRERALEVSRRLARLGRGERVALVAHTHPDFAVMFYACQYAGLVPVPLPAAVHLGGREAYVRHLRHMLADCKAVAAFAPSDFIGFLHEAATDLSMQLAGTLDDFMALDADDELPTPPAPSELAYLQYTSGSTRFPRGTMITHAAVMANLFAIFNHGFELTPEDRFCSWLPHYHDMGLVGIVLGCVATQRSVDYLPTRDFAMRPRLWLKLIARNRATISFSPPFGYTLCARRLRPADIEALDLSSWRVAGVGAEMIHPDSLRQVAEILAPAGFDEKAFLPCYGMAEVALAVSFAPVSDAPHSDLIDIDRLSRTGEAQPPREGEAERKGKAFVDCGKPLPGFEVEIRANDGTPLPERQCGTIFLKGPSVMLGYFDNPEASEAVLSADGWLNTGDLGYRADGSLYVTGRIKDLMIIKGRNIWPQDLEYLAEQEPEVRTSDASAFTVIDAEENETAVLVVQCREMDPQKLDSLANRLKQAIHAEFGIHCLIELVPPHTLPRTSSGKLSRSMARNDFLARCSEATRLVNSPVRSLQEENGLSSDPVSRPLDTVLTISD
ncbi:fatty acyl-AMP ligase [Xylophilus sp. GOD-11R]|uniref:fatty acyl-AMP ligase n=1 Tax=Xylophilus sp. GOD-11R TaxID=3089814 RepID=UPI00298BD839|nr:fatty acyl-AMP ligase [Xylophilus sp. GOD-11R]WPB58964.1 fatty acyl-AMP ligase [Xylophilus sp. GOD-11R]